MLSFKKLPFLDFVDSLFGYILDGLIRGIDKLLKGCYVCNMSQSERVTLEVKDILPPSQAAKFLGVSRMTLWRWVKKGKIRAIVFDKQSFFHIYELKVLKEPKEQETLQSAGRRK